MIGGQIPTPKYIRSAMIENEMTEEANITVNFQSGKEENIVVGANEKRNIESTIDEGSYKSCDPITQMLFKKSDHVLLTVK